MSLAHSIDMHKLPCARTNDGHLLASVFLQRAWQDEVKALHSGRDVGCLHLSGKIMQEKLEATLEKVCVCVCVCVCVGLCACLHVYDSGRSCAL